MAEGKTATPKKKLSPPSDVKPRYLAGGHWTPRYMRKGRGGKKS